MVGATRSILSLSLSSSFSRMPHVIPFLRLSKPSSRFHHALRPLCAAATAPAETSIADPDQLKHTILLERLRLRHLKESAAKPQQRPSSVVGRAGNFNHCPRAPPRLTRRGAGAGRTI
ncbi:hypothetical protein F2Q70_00006727 [Brassica cretica]|uniref:Uncharacterized protein n=1 Tax=Brassica cretica TaxID=69181 RepID=A0A8S9IQZ4_BRACR|nr:hypothetical protein F2Q70_00006727 [Brassica cretica]